jgi:leader peptidase (prepilin peptidase)/N-methyltransferase
MRVILTILAGLMGLAFGSFLNVCLTRWPAGESVVKPRSHCRNCQRALRWWENVPVLGWLALRGRCQTCGVRIGWRYLLVELSVGTLWAGIVWQFASWNSGGGTVSFSPLGLIEHLATPMGKMLLVFLLTGLAVLDAEHFWLPDIVTLPGIAVGIAVTLMRRGPLVATGPFDLSLTVLSLNLAFAILIAAGLILLIRWIYWLVRRREGIGLGDAKLMAMLAAWLGLPGALLAFAIGVALGALVGAAILVTRKHDAESPGLTKVPLGTFLCIGGIITTLWGQPIIAAYLRWAGLS